MTQQQITIEGNNGRSTIRMFILFPNNIPKHPSIFEYLLFPLDSKLHVLMSLYKGDTFCLI